MPYGLNNYKRTPVGLNTAAFADVVGIIRNNSQQATQYQSAIESALAQLPVNAAEDEWRTNLSNDIRNQLDAIENPTDKLLTATKLAGSTLNRPDVIGRIKAQAEYDNFVKQTQARTDIDQRTKNWALENNQYSYEDIRNNAGVIVGGTQWKPNITPVGQVDLSKLGTLALNWVKANVQNVNNATFVDEDGKPTSDITKAVDLLSNTSGKITSLGRDKVQEAINASIDMTPGARASIAQDRQVALWEYNKLTPEEKAVVGETEATDINGRPLTESEYLEKKLGHFLNATPYKEVDVKTNYGTGLQTAFALRKQAEAAIANLQPQNMEGVNFTGTGYNVTYNTSDYLNQAKGSINDAISTIEGAMPKLKDINAWKKAKAEGNYDKIEQIVREIRTKNGLKYYDAANPNVKSIVDDALRNIYNNKSFVSEAYNGLSDINKQALEARSAIDSGTIVDQNNRFFKDFNALCNNIAGGKLSDTDSFQLRFNTQKDLDIMLSTMGVDRASAQARGLEFGTEDDMPTITVKANNGWLPKTLISFANGRDDIFHRPGRGSEVRALDKNGNILSSSMRGSYLQSPFGGAMSLMDSLNTSINTHVSEINTKTGKISSTDQLIRADIPAIANARRDYGADSAEFGKIKKDVEESLAAALAQSDFTQLGIYGYDENTGGLTVMNNQDRRDIAPNIISHIQEGKATLGLGTSGVLTGYLVTTYGKRDKNGNVMEDSKPETVFITSGINDEALKEFMDDHATRAITEYNRRRSVGGSYRTYLGDVLTNIGNEGVTINDSRTPYSPQVGYTLIGTDKLIDDTVDYCKNIPNTKQGNELKEAKIKQASELIAASVGKQNNPEYKVKIYNTIYNHLRYGH